jgi:ubiquinone/menaquinone biosynthesis C-methylase UbiE
MWIRLTLALVLLGLSPAYAQETSVKPGINDHFQEPDVDRFVGVFEGESREIFQFRKEIVDALMLEPDLDVADVGAGTGFFSRMIAPLVAPNGTVYAVDIAEEFIEHIEATAEEANIDNIEARICTPRSIELPEDSVDLVFICDTYHHFEYPFDTMASIHHALRDGGRLVIVDFERVKGISDTWTLDHVRAGKGTVTDEVKDSGFEFLREIDLGMEGQYVLEFRKREPRDGE